MYTLLVSCPRRRIADQYRIAHFSVFTVHYQELSLSVTQIIVRPLPGLPVSKE